MRPDGYHRSCYITLGTQHSDVLQCVMTLGDVGICPLFRSAWFQFSIGNVKLLIG